MSHKRIFILFLILPLILFSISGCTHLQEAGIISPQPEKPAEQSEAQPQPEKPPEQPEAQPQPEKPAEQPAGAPRPAIEAKVTLSHAPKVGETAEAILTIIPNLPSGADSRNVRAWLEFSRIYTSRSYRESQEKVRVTPEEVLTEGNLNWEGTLNPDAPLEFCATVRFPEEGIWEITGYFDDIDLGFHNNRSRTVKLAVQTDRAGIYGSDAYRAGELEWMKDYSPTRADSPDTPNNDYPVIAELDLSKPPKLGETAELTWSITSIKDFENANVWIEFRLLEAESSREITPAAESILVEGNMEYEGAIAKGVPVSASAIVKFPSEGDWEITLRFFLLQKTLLMPGIVFF